MKTSKRLNRLRRIHGLILIQKTGRPNELARKLGISVSTLYNLLEMMKIDRFPIAYKRKSQSYFYTKSCKLEIDYEVRLTVDNDTFRLD